MLSLTLDNAMRTGIDKGNYALETISNRLDKAFETRAFQAKLSMQNLIAKLKALDPISIVQKGLWSVSCEGVPITELSLVEVDQSLTIRSVKGKITATVTEVSDEI